jgi:lipopolysaccharide transport system permease protein
MAVIYIVFLRILAGRGVPVSEIIIGVFAWQFTVQCVMGGMHAVTGSANLVKKVAFPRWLLPLSSTLANAVNFLLTLLVQFLILFALAGLGLAELRWTALLLPLLIAYHLLFNLGLALALSSLNVYFRDTQHLVGVLISAWFFMSPAMYNLSFLESKAEAFPLLTNLYLLNPMAEIITAYRAAILEGVALPLSATAWIGWFLPLLVLAGGALGFKRSQANFADML